MSRRATLVLLLLALPGCGDPYQGLDQTAWFREHERWIAANRARVDAAGRFGDYDSAIWAGVVRETVPPDPDDASGAWHLWIEDAKVLAHQRKRPPGGTEVRFTFTTPTLFPAGPPAKGEVWLIAAETNATGEWFVRAATRAEPRR